MVKPRLATGLDGCKGQVYARAVPSQSGNSRCGSRPGVFFCPAGIRVGLLAGLLLPLFVSAQPVTLSPSLSLEFRSEPGVSRRFVFFPWVAARQGRALGVGGGVGVAGLDNPGLAFWGADGSVRVFWGAWGELRLAGFVQGSLWRDWGVSELCPGGFLSFAGQGRLAGLELLLGAAWRRARFVCAAGEGAGGVWSEWALVYGVRQRVWSAARGEVFVWLANRDEFRLATPQELPFGVAGRVRLRPGLWASARLGSSLKGVSGLLFSLGGVRLGVGVQGEWPVGGGGR